MKKSSLILVFILSILFVLTVFPFSSNAVTADQYEYKSGTLTLKSGDFTPDFFKNLKYKTSVQTIIASGDVRFISSDWSQAFEKYTSCRTIDFSRVDTSEVTSMTSMFSGCTSLTSINLSGFDTSNVTSFSYMFQKCGRLTNLNLSNFNTSSAKAMNGMFSGCTMLSTVNLNGFNTSGVVGMNSMFYGCSSLTTLDLSRLKTSNVTNMSNMFTDCSGLTSLYLSGFDTSKVTNMSGMFENCKKLTSLDLSSFNTSNVTNMYHMFAYCNELVDLDISNFDTSNVTNMQSMFFDCNKLAGIDLSGFKTSNVTNMQSVFSGCSSLVSLDVSGFDTSSATDMSSMFSHCEKLTALDVSGFNTSNVTTMAHMFDFCSQVTSLDVSGFDTSNVKNMGALFGGCSGLTSLDVSGFDTSNIEDMAAMFYGCSGLTSIDVSTFDTSKVKYLYNMFTKCTALQSLDISNFDISNVTSFEWMFGDSNSLSSLTLPAGFTVQADMCLNNERGWAKSGTSVKISGDGEYAEFVSDGSTYVWLSQTSVVIPGDVDGNDAVTSDDAIHLLYHTFLPDEFPVNQDCDFDGNGVVDSDDAIYLLYYTFMPDEFPLNPSTAGEVTQITLSETELSMKTGDTVAITATVSPENATDKTVTWSSSDTSVATVSDGSVTAISKGTATITAASGNGLTAQLSVTVTEDVSADDALLSNGYFYNTLGDTEKQTYSEIYRAVSSNAKTADLSSQSSYDDAEKIGRFVLADHPELFHVSPEIGGSLTDGKLSLNFTYSMSASEYSSAFDWVNSTVSDVVNQAAGASDEFDKALIIYNYIKNTLSYDLQFSATSFDLYGALQTGKGVCEAYSELFSFLLDKVGISSIIVDGYAGEDHQWNMAKINGKWYYFDPTWDDPTGTQIENALYLNYFAVNDEIIKRDHTVINNEALLPAATSLDDNYFVKNGFVLSSLDENAMRTVAQNSFALCGHVAFMTTSDIYSEILGNSEYLFTLASYVGGDPSSISFDYSNSDNAYIIEIFITSVSR
jgi:surface protein